MKKCHCGNIAFDDILAEANNRGACDIQGIAREMGAVCICTACGPYLESYCKERLTVSHS